MQPGDEWTRNAADERRLQLREEREKMLSNVAALRRTLWEMRTSLHRLERLCEDVNDTRAEAGCLQEEINAAAERFDLARMGARKSK